MQRILISFIILLSLLAIRERTEIAYDLPSLEEKNEIGFEDLNGRLEYERRLTANPKTGIVPRNIRKLELDFSRQRELETASARRLPLDIVSAGPSNVGGRTRAVALDVRNEDIIIAGGVSGGIWKSMDGGQTWERKSDPLNRNSVTALVQDTRPGKEDTWYHGTGELFANSASGGAAAFRGNGIYKSTDNGETWDIIPSTVDTGPNRFNSQFQYIWDMEINDRNLVEDEILVAAFGGILRSIDGGDTWTAVVGQELIGLDPDVDLNDVNASFFTSIEKTVDGTFYATLSTFSRPDGNSPDAGIYLSEDGANWHDITPFSSGEWRRIVMGRVPTNPDKIFFLSDTNPPLIFTYELAGINAEGVPVGTLEDLSANVPRFSGSQGNFDAQGSFNMMIRVHPMDANLIFVGGTNLYRSRDGYTSSDETSWIGGYDPEGGLSVYLNHHPDQHEVVFYPSDPDKMLSASDGGLILTRGLNDDSVVWESLNSGYLTSQFFTIAMTKEAGDNTILGGMQDNGTDITSGSTEWNGLLGGDGGYAATTPGRQLWFSSFQRGQIFRLTLNNDLQLTSFGRVDPEPLVEAEGRSFLFITPFVLDPINSNRMFVAGGNYLYVNNNVSQIPGGSNEPTALGWERVEGSQLEEGAISALEMAFDGSVLYFGTDNGLFHRVSNVNDPLKISSEDLTSEDFPEGAYVSSISANPADPDHLMLVFSNYEVQSVFESTDGGQSFTNVSGNMEENDDGSGNGPSVRWAELIPTTTGTNYLLGTSVGLWTTAETNGLSTTWTKESQDLMGSAVVTMMDYRPADGKLVIATHGNGVFSTTIDDHQVVEVERPGENFQLIAAYPNPFQTSTRIQYSIPEDGDVRINLYSRKGELINTLLWGPQFAGENSIVWDGKNTNGTYVANGLYFYTVEYEGARKTGRLMLIN